jgi:Tfp pilus assembly protein PilF
MHLGLISYAKKDVEAAVDYFKKAIAADSKYTEAYHQLANILSNEDQLEAALPYYKKPWNSN